MPCLSTLLRGVAASLVLATTSSAISAHAAPAERTAAEPASRGAEGTASSATAEREGHVPSTEVPSAEDDGVGADAHDPFATRLRDGRIITGTTAHRALHFTFDDGPSEHTAELLDVLEEHGVHATFFLVARQLETERGRRMARRIADRGHTIGLHSYRHDDLTQLEAAELARDLDRAERVYEDVFEARPWLFRPPYGRHDDAVDVELAARGYTEVLWNITAGDGSARSAEEVVLGFREALDRQERMPRGQGGVVIFHDTHRWVVDAMPAIFAELEARNCALLASGSDLDEELWDVHDDLSAWHAPRRHVGANRRAARMRLADDDLARRQRTVRIRSAEACPPP